MRVAAPSAPAASPRSSSSRRHGGTEPNERRTEDGKERQAGRRSPSSAPSASAATTSPRRTRSTTASASSSRSTASGIATTRSTRRPADLGVHRVTELSRNAASEHRGRTSDASRRGRAGRRRSRRGPGRLRRAGQGDLRRHLHPGLPAHRRRGGRARRGAGDLPAGLPGPEALPGRRPVLDVDVPHHRQLRVHAPRQAPTRNRHDELDRRPRDRRAAPRPTPRRRADAAALRDRLQEALRDLPPRLRAVVVLRDIYDLPHEAIAAELGISESAAKVRLHRARRKLRERRVPAVVDRARSDARAV